MIHEIIKFVDKLPEEMKFGTTRPTNGLHIIIHLDEKGQLVTYDSFFVTKKSAYVDEWRKICKLEALSKYITINKAIDTKKKIHSINPYALWFKFQKPSTIKQKEWDNLSITEKYNKVVKDRVNFYYNYFMALHDDNEEQQSKIAHIKCFCENGSDGKPFIQLITETLSEKLEEEKQSTKTKSKSKKELTVNNYTGYVKIYFWFDDLSEEENFRLYEENYNNYIKEKIFNVDEYNIQHHSDIYGLSGFLNGANKKKMFITHQTTFFKVNNRISLDQALKLYLFEQIIKGKNLPNPLPIFIEEAELNEKVVRIYRETEGIAKKGLGFHEVIRQLFEERKSDLSNYYLINWSLTKDGLVINEVDYVPLFKYHLNNYIIHNLLNIDDIESKKTITNIFQFELEVVSDVLNNALVKVELNKRTGEIKKVQFHYFTDLKKRKVSHTLKILLLKYSKPFYDFIYKSNHSIITGTMFYHLLMAMIYFDVKEDKKRYNTRQIKRKLNILFSLNSNFDPQNNNFGGINMVSRIPELQEKVKNLVNNEEDHITSDDEFAFAAGQLIYYILSKSQSSRKTHALLEPYLSKEKPEIFKLIITRGINQYKHAFKWYGNGKGRFEKLASEVLGYDCKSNIKDLHPLLLAGYFSESVIYTKEDEIEE